MRTLVPLLRLVAVAMVVVIAVTVATPEPAHADPLAAIGIATLIVCGVIVIVYLIVASTSESRGAADPVSGIASIQPVAPAGVIVAGESP